MGTGGIVRKRKEERDRKDRNSLNGPIGPVDRDRKDQAPLRGRSSVHLFSVM